MSSRFSRTRGASIPAESLAELAGFRREATISVLVVADRAWLRWDREDDRIARCLLALPGVELFDRRDDLWHRFGHRLPAFGLPLDVPEFLPLSRAVTPEPIYPAMPPGFAPNPARLQLVRDLYPRSATALRCRLPHLVRWADLATTFRLGSLTAALSKDHVVIRGENLPMIAESERFWGDRLLVPMGFRPEPALAESALLAALGISGQEMALLADEGCEVLPWDAFRPMTRAAVRWAVLEASP